VLDQVLVFHMLSYDIVGFLTVHACASFQNEFVPSGQRPDRSGIIIYHCREVFYRLAGPAALIE